MKYLGNALSLGMLDELEHLPAVTLTVAALDNAAAAKWTAENEWESCVGHADTARLLSSLLAQDVQMRRVSTSLVVGDELLVAQYNGPRSRPPYPNSSNFSPMMRHVQSTWRRFVG